MDVIAFFPVIILVNFKEFDIRDNHSCRIFYNFVFKSALLISAKHEKQKNTLTYTTLYFSSRLFLLLPLYKYRKRVE